MSESSNSVEIDVFFSGAPFLIDDERRRDSQSLRSDNQVAAALRSFLVSREKVHLSRTKRIRELINAPDPRRERTLISLAIKLPNLDKASGFLLETSLDLSFSWEVPPLLLIAVTCSNFRISLLGSHFPKFLLGRRRGLCAFSFYRHIYSSYMSP